MSTSEKESVPIMATYDEKVVYTTDLSYDEKVLELDCDERGGEFNTCGTPCGPDEAFCTAVCAYTCELAS